MLREVLSEVDDDEPPLDHDLVSSFVESFKDIDVEVLSVRCDADEDGFDLDFVAVILDHTIGESERFVLTRREHPDPHSFKIEIDGVDCTDIAPHNDDEFFVDFGLNCRRTWEALNRR